MWRALRGKSWANLYYRYGLSVHVREWARVGFELSEQTGFYWAPLPRDSNGAWVAVAATLERLTGLRLLVGWSPLDTVLLPHRYVFCLSASIRCASPIR